MPPVLRSNHIAANASATTRRSSKRRRPLASQYSCKNKTKMHRRKRSFFEPIAAESPDQGSFQQIGSAPCFSSSFQLESAALSGVLPLNVKKKRRSIRQRSSRKKLPEVCHGRVPEVANSGTSVVDGGNFEVFVPFSREEPSTVHRSKKRMRSSGKEGASDIKCTNSEGSYSIICEGSNSFMPETSERLVQQYSTVDQARIEEGNLFLREVLVKREDTDHEGFELPSEAKEPSASISGSTVQMKGEELPYDLACTEELSFSCHENQGQDWNFSFETNEFSDSSLTSFGDLLSDVFEESSGHEFSEGRDETIHSSPCFLLFLQYKKEFFKSERDVEISGLFLAKVDNVDEYQRFVDNDDEETYNRFRCSERRNFSRGDYVDELGPTEFGDIIYTHRVSAVEWIVEHCSSCQLQWETTFLSVSILDRFLRRGFFKSESRLQILGIACATLATRIEENQPYNCVRQEEFHIKQNVYGKYEVVAMEWMILEVLSFRCFSITTFNFLRFYLKLVNADQGLENYTKYLALLSLAHHEMLYFWPSTVAAGLVIQACLAKGAAKDHAAVRRTHIRTKEDHEELESCIKLLETMDDG